MYLNYEMLNLPKSQADVVEFLNINQPNYVSTLDFLKNEVLSPAACIAKLKEKGVIFETIYKTVVDTSGNVHMRIAHYRIVGFQ